MQDNLPTLVVDLGPDGKCPLSACEKLASVDPQCCHHATRDMRMPLGIYNASLGRLCPRVKSYCQSIEPLFGQSFLAPPGEDQSLRTQVVRDLEAMFYSAAEHVDDIESLASGFFKSNSHANKDSRFKALRNAIDKAKKFISTAANKIKHNQARIRLLSIEMHHGGHDTTLHGFYIEGVVDGVIAPHPAVHAEFPVLSLTATAWRVIEFIVAVNRALDIFLESIPKHEVQRTASPCRMFVDAVKAAARLPAFTFGESHPLTRRPLKLVRSPTDDSELASGLYGSIDLPWTHSKSARFGQITQSSEGDGASRSFKLVSPKAISLVRWSN